MTCYYLHHSVDETGSGYSTWNKLICTCTCNGIIGTVERKQTCHYTTDDMAVTVETENYNLTVTRWVDRDRSGYYT